MKAIKHRTLKSYFSYPWAPNFDTN